MALHHAGIALFVLLYVYVYFKHAAAIRDVAEADVERLSAWQLIQKMGAFGLEVLAVELVLFLALFVLTMTCFRALSQLSLGRPVDGFALWVAFAWLMSPRVLIALFAGTLLSVGLVAALVLLSKAALQRPVRPVVPKRAGVVRKYVLQPVYLAGYHLRVLLLPHGIPPATVRDTLVRSVLLVHLLTQAACIVLAYADLSVAEGLLEAGAAKVMVNALTDEYVPPAVGPLGDIKAREA